MADKTFGVKVNEELYQQVQEMIDNSSLTAKDWFEKAVTLVSMNDLKEGSVDFKQDLNELEVHTTRIFELVVNMVQRASYLKESETRELAEKVNQKDIVISEYQLKFKEYEEYIQSSEETTRIAEEKITELVDQVEGLKLTNVNNQELIKEYKEKIDSLSGIVNKYKEFAEENEVLREQFGEEKERLVSQIDELLMTKRDYEDQIEGYVEKIEIVNKNHDHELDRLIEKKDYEKDRELLNQEKEFQSQIAKIQSEYNKEVSRLHSEHNKAIKGLYDEIDKMRKEYEDKISKE